MSAVRVVSTFIMLSLKHLTWMSDLRVCHISPLPFVVFMDRILRYSHVLERCGGLEVTFLLFSGDIFCL